ncbi:hypothetical protein GE061_015734 [Apolygus lucorum]|uniref:Reverse transcriptase domain-containing protein n=1 Tax=Apolygus lucorum TaxID=248454 RepID=A0A8S9XMY9_APOLU|nr:hypothetical protein GE061_015734 [Apolygus lucorum]
MFLLIKIKRHLNGFYVCKRCEVDTHFSKIINLVDTLYRIGNHCRIEGYESSYLQDLARRVAAYLGRIFPRVGNATMTQHQGRPPPRVVLRGCCRAAKQARWQEYHRVQSLWRKHPARVAAEVLEEPEEDQVQPPLQEFVDFWEPLLSAPSHNPGERVVPPVSTRDSLRSILCSPALLDEAHKCCPLDRMKGESGPGGYRLISVSSVVFRHFQKVLASRLQVAGVIGDVQRAFWPADGTAENLTVLQTVISLARIKRRQLHLAAMDVAKAFDTVSHLALTNGLRGVGPHLG